MKTHREQRGLIGPVKSVRQEAARFEEQHGELLEQPSYGFATTFNQDGWVTESVNLHREGPDHRFVCEYSDPAPSYRRGITTTPATWSGRKGTATFTTSTRGSLPNSWWHLTARDHTGNLHL